MSPKKSNGSWRGPCPFRNLNKSIWSLLGKGIGKRCFRLLTRRVESDISLCFFVHYAVNMLSMLLKCQFINSGLISIRHSNRNKISLLIAFILLPCVCARTHINNEGKTCIISTCPAGTEAVPCTVDWTADQCRPCPADKYQVEDNVPSDMKLRCYSVHLSCMPDTQHLVQIGKVSAANPPKCVCDTSRNLYQHGNNPDDCRKRKCPSTKQLLLNGTCVCQEGRVVNSEGDCEWETMERTDLTTPASLSTFQTETNAQTLVTSKSSTISDPDPVMNTTINEETAPHETDYTPTVDTSSPLISTTSTTTTTSTTVRHDTIIAVIILVSIILLICIWALGMFVYKCLKKRRQRSATISAVYNSTRDQGERLIPSELVVQSRGKHTYVQIGTNNTMNTGRTDGNKLPPSA